MLKPPLFGSTCNNSFWINASMNKEIMIFNCFKMYIFFQSNIIVQIPNIITQIWIIFNSSNTALKMNMINWIKSYQCLEKTQVSIS